MEISDKPDEDSKECNVKLINKIGIDGYQSLFNTLLGCTNNICNYVINTSDLLKLPNSVKYSMLQVHSILTYFSKILHGEETDCEIGGYFPVDGDSWKSEEDFEKRLILFVKLYYKHLKKEGKL